MDALSLKNLSFVAFLLALSLARVEPTPLAKWQIHLVNGLSNGETLFVHCKSKEDDLGEHNLGIGAEFNWRFKVNLWDTTLYWCYVRKSDAQVSFDIFWVEKKSSWLKDRCSDKNCIWVAEDHGVYLKDNRYNTEELVYPWKVLEEHKK